MLSEAELAEIRSWRDVLALTLNVGAPRRWDRQDLERVADMVVTIDALTAERDAERALAANVLTAWRKVQGANYNGQEDWDRLVIALDQMSAAVPSEKHPLTHAPAMLPVVTRPHVDTQPRPC